MTKSAKDGTEFGVFDQGNGTYVARIDDGGFHYSPPSYRTLPSWSPRQARVELIEAIRRYEATIATGEEEE